MMPLIMSDELQSDHPTRRCEHCVCHGMCHLSCEEGH
jgi:hypothetical protein